MKLCKVLIVAGVVLLSFNCLAAERSATGTIKRFITYESGAVFVSLSTNGTICTWGYWLGQDSLGYKGIVSALLAAYHSKSSIAIYGDNNKRWTGSSNPTCKIVSIDHN